MKDNEFLNYMKAFGQKGEHLPETTGFIDTGSYIFNAMLSASLYGGIPNNRVTALAGEYSSYKSFFALSALKQFQDDHPNGGALLYDTEYAVDESMLNKRGIDPDRTIVQYPEHLQDFRNMMMKFTEGYKTAETKLPIMCILDSLGNLPSLKELEDAKVGKEVKDMTRTQVIRSIFRTLTLTLGKLQIPMIVTNHTYQVIGSYVPTKAMSGGGGIAYASSHIVQLSKKKDKDGNDVTGNIITAKMEKSRFSKEQKVIQLRANFETGLERYYGLLPLAEKYDIIKKVSTRYEMPDGSKHWEKDILKNPEKYYTVDIMKRLEEAAKTEYSLGSTSPHEEPDVEALEMEVEIENNPHIPQDEIL